MSQALRQQLLQTSISSRWRTGCRKSLDRDRDLLLAHRYVLSPAVTPERFTEAGLRAAITDSVDFPLSPLGALFKPYLTRDPTGELPTLIRQLNASAPGRPAATVCGSRQDGERAVLLAQTRALGSDTDGQEVALNAFNAAFAALSPRFGDDFRLTLSGPGKFAVDARATIKDDIQRLTLISMLAIFAVLFTVYRSSSA